MKNESTTQCVKIQIRPAATAEMVIPIPSYWHFGSIETVAMIKVINEDEFIIVDNKSVVINSIGSLDIYIGDGSYRQCEPSQFYQYYAAINDKINRLSGIEFFPLQHELTNQDLAQLRYDEGRDLINEDRVERDENRKYEISHDYNY